MASLVDAALMPPIIPDKISYMVRPDYRDCVSPWCGGFWLKTVNEEKTECGDGTVADECYVTEFDFSVLGYTDDERARFNQEISSGGIVSGSYAPYVWSNDAKLSMLVVSAGWSPFMRDFD
jgi:hypothetical protein